MRFQLADEARDARLDALLRALGPSPILELRSGPLEADCGAASAGALLARGILPAIWVRRSAPGASEIAGVWNVIGVEAGMIGHFRMFAQARPNRCLAQGDVAPRRSDGGKADAVMVIDRIEIEARGQVVRVEGFDLTEGNR